MRKIPIAWEEGTRKRKKEVHHPNLECKLAKALQGVGKVTIKHFPDGTPYQTNFEFKTTQVLR